MRASSRLHRRRDLAINGDASRSGAREVITLQIKMILARKIALFALREAITQTADDAPLMWRHQE